MGGAGSEKVSNAVAVEDAQRRTGAGESEARHDKQISVTDFLRK